MTLATADGKTTNKIITNLFKNWQFSVALFHEMIKTSWVIKYDHHEENVLIIETSTYFFFISLTWLCLQDQNTAWVITGV